MKLRLILTVASVISFVFGVAAVVFPTMLADMYGLTTGPSEILLGRFFGVEMLVIAFITWLARDFAGPSSRPLVMGHFLGDAVGVIVAVLGVLTGVMNPVGWSAVVIYLGLTLSFAYFLFMAPAK